MKALLPMSNVSTHKSQHVYGGELVSERQKRNNTKRDERKYGKEREMR